MPCFRRIRFGFFALLAWLATPPPAPAEPLRVFAAASLSEAVDEALERWGEDGIGVYAGSATLARQIFQGAPADLFLSANPDWIAWLDDRGALRGAPRDFAANRLVVVAHDAAPRAALLAAAAGRKLAIADPGAAPAGIYARQALKALGVWDRWRGRILIGASVRDALAWVARGEADLAVVYATDARLSPGLASAPLAADLHAPIRYRGAAVAGGAERAAGFMAYLLSPQGQAVLARHGFAPPAPPRESAAQ